MYLQNPFYSNIDLYLKELNKYLLDDYELKAEYKTYDKSKDDDVTFIIFNIRSNIKNKKNNFIINEFNYEGNLIFVYNKLTNTIIVKELPTIYYNNKIKLPVFTQDLATIVINQLNKYIEQEKIVVTFENPFNIVVIDQTVKDIIPSIKDTRNYKILNVIIETISKEIKKIEQDVANYKSHYDRLIRSKERAINKKRIILGVNPLDYDTQEKFSNALDERLLEVFTTKYNNIERHLKLNENKYKKLLDSEKLDDYAYYILKKYVSEKDNKEKIPLEFKKIIEKALLEFEEYLCHNNCDYYYDYYDWKKCVKYDLKDFFDETNFVTRYKQDIINTIYNYDLYNENGALNILKLCIFKVRETPEFKLDKNNNYCKLSSDCGMKFFCKIVYGLSQSLLPSGLNYDFTYHPIFYEEVIKDKFRYRNIEECIKIIKPFYKSKNFKSGFNLLQQISKLKEKEKIYKEVIENPKSAILDFRTFSANWGNIINIPYWYIYDYSNHTTRGEYSREIFTLFFIKPGTINIDFSKIRGFKRNWHKTLEKGFYNPNIFEDEFTNRFIITIPKTLNYDNIKEILNKLKYGKFIVCNQNMNLEDYQLRSKCSNSWLNIICESFDKYLFIKEYLIKKLINGDTLATRIFVNCDPEYYNNYLVETPTNEVLWHKYDFTSDYKYRRKYLLDLRGQFYYAKEYLFDVLNITSNNSEYQNILEEILLGSYSNSTKYKEYIQGFKEYLILIEMEMLSGKQDSRIKFEYQKRREECSRITGISKSIEGERDCVKILQNKYKPNIMSETLELAKK